MSQFCIVLDRPCEFVMVTLRTFFVLGVLSSVVVIFLGGSFSEVLAASEEIHQLSPCACKIGDKIVDLSPLGNRNNTPRCVYCYWKSGHRMFNVVVFLTGEQEEG